MIKIVLSSPEEVTDEFVRLNALFEEGLSHFHLRKPDFTEKQLEAYLKQVKPLYLKRVVLHSHHSLIRKYNLKGIHLRTSDRQKLGQQELQTLVKELRKKGLTISTSCHSLDEIETLSPRFDYVFLSPIFKSISKMDYPAAFSKEELITFFKERKSKVPVIALGGLTPENAVHLADYGFDGAAFLGSIWQ
jgi:thiamine-phosphate pyrophosphorylase